MKHRHTGVCYAKKGLEKAHVVRKNQVEHTEAERNVLAIVQAQIERVVLLQENGSFSQRVSAEFLRELVQQVEKNAPASEDDAFDAAAFVREQVLGDDA